MRLRFGIRTLLLSLAVVAVFFPFQSFYSHWFRSSYSGYHVHQTLRDYVSVGDSFEYVSSLFDRTESRTKQWIDKHAPVLLSRKSIFADHENGDEYHIFTVDGGNVRALFQFRDGLVVNHLNNLYQFPYSSVKHPNDKSPSLFFRIGATPSYIAVLLSLGLFAWAVRILIPPRQTNA